MGTVTDDGFSPGFLVKIVAKNDGGEAKVTGTGFFVTEKGHVATCLHVILIDGRVSNSIWVQFQGGEPKQYFALDHLPVDDDLIVLAPPLGSSYGRSAATLLRDSTEAIAGDGYRLWGYADGRTVEPGRIALSVATFFPAQSRIGLNGLLNSGDSGAPLLLGDGRTVAGIAQSKTTTIDGRGVAIPTVFLIQILKRHKLKHRQRQPSGEETWWEKEDVALSVQAMMAAIQNGTDPMVVAPAVKPAESLPDRLANTHHLIDMVHVDLVVDRVCAQDGPLKAGALLIEQHARMAGELCVKRIVERAAKTTGKQAICDPPIDLRFAATKRRLLTAIAEHFKERVGGEDGDDEVLELVVGHLADACASDVVRVFEFSWWLPSDDRPDVQKEFVARLWAKTLARVKKQGGERHLFFVLSCKDRMPDKLTHVLQEGCAVDPKCLYRLGLKDYAKDDIEAWLRSAGGLKPPALAKRADTLFSLSNGSPQTLLEEWRSAF